MCARFSFERSCRKTVYSVLAGMSSQANCCCFCCYFFFCEQQREKERERMQLRQKWAPLTYNDFVVGIAVCLYATFLLCKTPFSRSPLQPLLTPPRFDCMFLLEPDTHTTIITRFVSLSLSLSAPILVVTREAVFVKASKTKRGVAAFPRAKEGCVGENVGGSTRLKK